MKKLIALSLSIWIFSASAQELVEFENGQVANAEDINSNFQALKEAVQGIDVGAALLTGEGTPEDSLGAIGDFFIDSSAYALYGPKTDQGWGIGTSLIGPTGADGEDGAQATLPRDTACKQSDLVGQWYQTKGISGGFEISVSNFFSSGDYVLEGLQYTVFGEEEFTVFGSYEFSSNICGFTLEITNLSSAAVGVMNLDKSVMKLTAADGSGEYADFTLILVSEQPADRLLNKATGTGLKKAKSVSPKDFVPIELSFDKAGDKTPTQ